MVATGDLVEAQENHLWLLREFVRLLLREAPASVLDVGCGAGRLLESCRDAGVTVRGIDQAGPRLEALRTAGHDVIEGTAYVLPARDRSVDWVTLRHVPHHLEDPPRALAEALRVARHGVLVAEPCYDTSLAAGRTALAVDAWEKVQHRRGGMHHAEVMDLNALLQAMPEDLDLAFEVEVHRSQRLCRRSPEVFEREAQELVADLPAQHAEREVLATLLSEIERTGLGFNGSQCVLLRRRLDL